MLPGSEQPQARAPHNAARAEPSRGQRHSPAAHRHVRTRNVGPTDRALAGGAEPTTNRLLAKRAAQLTSRWTRSNVAGVLEADLDEARWFDSQQDVAPRARQRELFLASRELRQLIDRLLDDREVRAQGILRLQQLLTDGRGPMYGHGQPGALQHELKEAIDLLDA